MGLLRRAASSADCLTYVEVLLRQKSEFLPALQELLRLEVQTLFAEVIGNRPVINFVAMIHYMAAPARDIVLRLPRIP